VASLLWGLVTGDRLWAVFCAAVLTGSLLRRSGATLSTPAQVLVLVAAGVAAVGWQAIWPSELGLADRPLPRSWPFIGAGALLLAAVRTHLRNPNLGLGGTLALGLFVFLACGRVTSGSVYIALLLPYLVLSFRALSVDDIDGPPWRRLGWRHTAALAFMLVSTGILTTGFVYTAYKAYEHAHRWALHWVANQAKSGFHDGEITLGSLDSMLLSDEVVMRMEGPVAGPLRGNVYTHYSHHRWRATELDSQVELRAGEPLALTGAASTVIHYALSDVDRFFLPLDAEEVHLSPARARVDAMGIFRAFPDEHPVVVQIRTGPERRFAIAAPTPADLQVPANIETAIGGLAQEWASGEESHSGRLRALVERLERDYAYYLPVERGATEVQPAGNVDPVLQFLLRDRKGHCEYFASALALLGRSVGIPSRVVTGYRVVERNPLGNYYIVRERHAHAWVEVHLAGHGWVSVDPSPLRSFEGETATITPWLAAVLDLAVVAWQRHGLIALLISMVATLVGIQIWRLVRPAHGGRHRAGRSVPRPPAYVEAFLRELSELGLPRGAGESLEHYARRVDARSADADAIQRLSSAGRLLRDYAALRYGEIGTAATLRAEVRGWLEKRTS
jgi:transglutaminase-like putative cysteine protease